MKIPFGQSRQSTIGIEWELAVVDATTLEQVPEAEVVLSQVEDPVDGPIRREYLTSMIELVSGVHETVGAAVAELRQHLEWALDLLEPRGLTLLGVGSIVGIALGVVSLNQIQVHRQRGRGMA